MNGRTTSRGLVPGREIHVRGKRGDRGRGRVIRIFEDRRGTFVEYRERFSGCARFCPLGKVVAR